MHPFIPKEALENHTDKTSIWPAFDERAASRRTIYAFTKRSLLVPMLEVLDLCDTARASAKRNVTTVPTQALTLYNGQFVNSQAAHLAARLRAEAGDDLEKQVDLAWRLALCRAPKSTELVAMQQFFADELSQLRADQSDAKPAELHQHALAQLCRVLLNLNEFVYPD
jgi:hypothetical protein